MPTQHAGAAAAAQARRGRPRWDSLTVAGVVRAYRASAGTGGERARAAMVEKPRATVLGFVDRCPLNGDEEAQFFMGPAGRLLLQSIVLAVTMTFEIPGTDGLGKLEQFLKLSGLGAYVAHSRGWLHKFVLATMAEMNAFEAQVLPQLKAGVQSTLLITLALDETFFPRVCLVAIDPVSGFIFVECFAEKRDAETWIAALKAGLADLNVEVVQGTSDQGKAILNVINEEWGAQYSPDLLHVQHDLGKGTMAVLSREQRSAQEALDGAVANTKACREAHESALCEPRGPGRPPDHPRRVAEAQHAQEQAAATLQQATAVREEMHGCIRGLSEDYHPYDIKTGKPRSAAELESKLEGWLQKARDVVTKAKLPQYCARSVEKAGRAFPLMVNTMDFFHRLVGEQVATLPVGPELLTAILVQLIPALYLQRAAKKARRAESSDAIAKVAQALLATFYATPAWLQLDDATRDAVSRTATWCADLFQRSSSCVEGRNGQLSLFHHALHRLSPAKLHALTIIHNYFIRRRDGTTAAERLFGVKHDDLFKWLILRVPMPPFPAPHNARGAANARRERKVAPTPPAA